MASTRRDFLQNTFAMLAAGSVYPFLFPRSVFAQAADMGAAPKNRRLVIVQMMGGNDGMNTLIPYKDPAYGVARSTLRYTSAEVLDLSGSGFGLHPGMTALRDLYDAGRVAVVQGVGYPEPNRSHFESTDIWETADPTLSNYIGWAGKLLDEIHDQQGGLAEGVAVASELPLTLIAEKALVQTIEDPTQYQILIDAKYNAERSALLRAFSGMYAAAPQEDSDRQYVRNTGNDTYTGTSSFQGAIRNYQSKTSYPTTGIGPQLQSIAQMLIGGSPTQVYHTTIGGFDTHSGQRGPQGNLLKNLSDSLAAFYTDLMGHSMEQDVTVVTFSEFGRRVHENGSGGTDHGAASVLFVMGGMVKGGLIGNYPSLTDLGDGDLKFNVDFRSVYATLIDKWMGADADTLLGIHLSRLGFYG